MCTGDTCKGTCAAAQKFDFIPPEKPCGHEPVPFLGLLQSLKEVTTEHPHILRLADGHLVEADI